MELSLECKEVANYICEKINEYNESVSFDERILLSIRRLQKLLYFCDVLHIIQNDGKSMFSEEFHAWPSGPVVPGIYDAYMELASERLGFAVIGTLPEETKSIIDKVLDVTKNIETEDLEEISKEPGGPWQRAFNPIDDRHFDIVTKEDIYNFYIESSNTIFWEKIGSPYRKLLNNTDKINILKKRLGF